MSSKFVAILSLLLISGCAATRNNVVVSEPTDGARARIRIAMPSNRNGRNVIAYPNSACVGDDVPGKGRVLSNYTISFEKTLNNKKIGMPQTAISENTDFLKSEIYAQAGVPIALLTFKIQTEIVTSTNRFYTTVARYGDGCRSMITFIPNENSDYEVIFGNDRGSCEASVNRIVENQMAPSLVPIQFSQSTACTNEE